MSHSQFCRIKAYTETCMAYSLRQAYDYWQDQPGYCNTAKLLPNTMMLVPTRTYCIELLSKYVQWIIVIHHSWCIKLKLTQNKTYNAHTNVLNVTTPHHQHAPKNASCITSTYCPNTTILNVASTAHATKAHLSEQCQTTDYAMCYCQLSKRQS